MKSFTDIEQSKKLIELGLNADTADMHYSKWDNDENEEYHLECGGLPKLKFKYATNIPAWSLSALLSILPRYLNYNDDKLRLNLYTLDFENQYRKDHCWIVGYWDYDEETEEYNFQIRAKENEVIDACYELILKLHERKLLN